MNKLYYTAALAALIGLSTPAQAQTSRIYFAGYLGVSTLEDVEFDDAATPSSGTIEPENTPTFAGALGLRFSRNLRGEVEVSYRSADFDTANVIGTGNTPVTGDLKSSLLMLNGYYDFDIRGWKIQPYLTAGVGVGYHKGDITDAGAFTSSVSDNDFGFVWNAGAGLKYRTRDNFAWTTGYRYLDGSEIDLGQTTLDLSSHEIRVGLEWDLGY